MFSPGRIGLLICLGAIPAQAQQWLPDSFNPGAGPVRAIIVQVDGNILVGGQFTGLGGGNGQQFVRNRIGRLHSDGTVDAAFNPGADDTVLSLARQADGKILVGGRFEMLGGGGTGTTARTYIGRLNTDGSLDNGFNPGAAGWAQAIAVQPDGKILVGLAVNASGNHLLRLNPDGTPDAGFTTTVNSAVYAIALQPDGKILIAGDFNAVNDVTRYAIARLNANGTLDSAFNPGCNNTVLAMALQPDGKIVVGGSFSRLGGGLTGNTTRRWIGRLNGDGTLDTGWDPGANAAIWTLKVQPDGKILAGGNFLGLGGGTGTTDRYFVGRINPDGTVDTAFDSGTDEAVFAFALQADGKILVGGDFFNLGPGFNGCCTARLGIGRLGSTSGLGQLRNISTREQVLTGNEVAIAGFIISGTGLKNVLIRGIGPTLTQLGVANALADPFLNLFQGATQLATNNNWKDSQQAAIQATGKPPPNNAEAAILRSLPPGAYTAILSGVNSNTGVGLIEAYDVDASGDAFLSNISTRGSVGTNSNVMIGGFICGGGSVKVLVRGLGPTLTQFGVANVLADPVLGIFDGNGNALASNDNWQNTQQAEIQATGRAPPNMVEPAVIIIRPAGNTTAIVSGKNNTSGVGLVEVYAIP